MKNVDVTLSVWNKFHSFELISGLVKAGYQARSLDTVRRRSKAQEYKFCLSSAFMMQAAYQMPKSAVGQRMRRMLAQGSLLAFENYAARYATDARCFWCWNNHNLKGMQRAKAAGIPVILETGSTHARWADRRLHEEHEYRSLKYSGHSVSYFTRCDREYGLADIISVPSRFVANTFIEEGISTEKLNINPYGVDVEFWGAKGRSCASRPITFVYTAALTLRKGIPYLMDAWRKADLKDARLYLIGGQDAEILPYLKNLPDNVTPFGFMPHTKVREIYRECDAYLLPSLEEGQARSVLEAMAAGLMPIITEETGATDIMVPGEDGLLVQSRNVDSLVEAFRFAAANRERVRAMGESAKKRVQPYTWDAYGKRCAQLLEKMIGPPAGKRS